MKASARCLSLLFLMFAGAALCDDLTPFDVEPGRVATLYSGDLEPGSLVSCSFSDVEAYVGSKWLPSVSVSFSPADQTKNDLPTARLTAYQSKKNPSWRHEFTTRTSKDRESRITVHSGTDAILPMHLFLTTDQYVALYVGDSPEEMSMIDVSQHNLVEWKVYASGVKGSADCKCVRTGGDDGD